MDQPMNERQHDLMYCDQAGMRVGYDDGQRAIPASETSPNHLANRLAAEIFRRMLDSCSVEDRPLEEAARIALGYRRGYLAGLTQQRPERGTWDE